MPACARLPDFRNGSWLCENAKALNRNRRSNSSKTVSGIQFESAFNLEIELKNLGPGTTECRESQKQKHKPYNLAEYVQQKLATKSVDVIDWAIAMRAPIVFFAYLKATCRTR